ncbi:hypothetical protein GQX74_013882 [Glossina fuscipes]|nr:hypothetical protein GQX74_013882 [Glossina fuscipes]
MGKVLNTPCMTVNWEIRVTFKVHGKSTELFDYSFAIWYAKERMQPGPVFGSKDHFSGLVVILDTYIITMDLIMNYPNAVVVVSVCNKFLLGVSRNSLGDLKFFFGFNDNKQFLRNITGTFKVECPMFKYCQVFSDFKTVCFDSPSRANNGVPSFLNFMASFYKNNFLIDV